MSGFGAFAPLPLRLGGSAEEGLTAEQHARLCADLVAVRRSAPTAIINFTKSGGTITVHWYAGPTGVLVADYPFTTASGGTGVTTFAFPTYFEDEYERAEPYAFNGGGASLQAATAGDANVLITSANTFTVNTFDGTGTLADGSATVEIYGRGSYPAIGDYDGAADKQNTKTEKTAYAWVWYQEYTGMLGSAFTREMTGPVHGTKLALARMHAALDRAQEAMANNALPGSSDVMLAEWIDALNVISRGSEDKHLIRQRAAAKFRSGRGNSKTDVDATVSELLGDFFVQIYRQHDNALSSPPTITYWPGINPGPTEYDIGGGTWMSERCHLTVEVTKPAGLPDADWLTLMNVDLYRELDVLLPAWATFNWAVDIGDGFELDIDELDFTGLTPS